MKPHVLTIANAYLPTPVAPPASIEVIGEPAKTPELQAAYALVHQLLGEVDRAKRNLETQRARYERLLDEERRELTQLMKTRDERSKLLSEQNDRLREENARLSRECEELSNRNDQAGQAYRSAIIGLQRAFERRLETEPLLVS